MKAKELTQMSPEELQGKVKELKGELFNLRFQLATGQLQNTMQLSGVKRDIARVMTVLRQVAPQPAKVQARAQAKKKA